MDPITVSALVDSPRQPVFDLILDMSARPAFTDHFQHDFRLARLESSGVGASARFAVKKPRGGGWMDTAIVEVDPPHRIVEQGRCGRMNRTPQRTVWELTEGPGKVTTVEVTFDTDPPTIFDRTREFPEAERYYRRGWHTALRRLAGLVESGQVPERVEVAGSSRERTGVR